MEYVRLLSPVGPHVVLGRLCEEEEGVHIGNERRGHDGETVALEGVGRIVGRVRPEIRTQQLRGKPAGVVGHEEGAGPPVNQLPGIVHLEGNVVQGHPELRNREVTVRGGLVLEGAAANERMRRGEQCYAIRTHDAGTEPKVEQVRVVHIVGVVHAGPEGPSSVRHHLFLLVIQRFFRGAEGQLVGVSLIRIIEPGGQVLVRHRGTFRLGRHRAETGHRGRPDEGLVAHVTHFQDLLEYTRLNRHLIEENVLKIRKTIEVQRRKRRPKGRHWFPPLCRRGVRDASDLSRGSLNGLYELEEILPHARRGHGGRPAGVHAHFAGMQANDVDGPGNRRRGTTDHLVGAAIHRARGAHAAGGDNGVVLEEAKLSDNHAGRGVTTSENLTRVVVDQADPGAIDLDVGTRAAVTREHARGSDADRAHGRRGDERSSDETNGIDRGLAHHVAQIDVRGLARRHEVRIALDERASRHHRPKADVGGCCWDVESHLLAYFLWGECPEVLLVEHGPAVGIGMRRVLRRIDMQER